ncbi:MAG: peptidoglycan-binding protein [Candidatus Paceibacterota bacterium]|jgi:streptogramin lyase
MKKLLLTRILIVSTFLFCLFFSRTAFAATLTLGTTGALPFDLVVDGAGNIYTANYVASNVSKITPAGVSTVLGVTGTSPVAITIDAAGNVYTANSGSNNVSKITPAGVSTILGTTGSSPYGITIDGAGNVYTANIGSNDISKITPAGVSTIFATTGTSAPYDIILDGAGNLYTANPGTQEIWKITPAGVASVLGTTASNAYNLVMDSAGNIYAPNSNPSYTISKITPAGASSIFAAVTADSSNITIDSIDNLYISNSFLNNVEKITPLGVLTVVGTTGLYPRSVAVDATGNIYTGDSDSNTITKITNPAITETIPVPNPTTTDGLFYTFDSNSDGVITYGGSCSSATTNAVVGSNTITFNTLAIGTYSNCSIFITDGFGQSNTLSLGLFYVGGSHNATVSSTSYTVSVGGTPTETISNVPYGTSKATFLANLTPNYVVQTWNDIGVHDPVINGDTLIITAEDGTTIVTYDISVIPPSADATITSATYTVTAGGTANETISNVMFGTSKATFLANLSQGYPVQTLNDIGIHDPVVNGDILVVTAEDGITIVTYTVAVNPQLVGPASLIELDIDIAGTASFNSYAYGPKNNISLDNRYVVFSSSAENLVLDDTNLVTDIFLRDTQTNTTTRVSVATDGAEGNASSYNTAISSDGRYVVFQSDATNLVLDDINGMTDIFLRDTQTNTTTRVSVATDGAEGNASSYNTAISSDGRYVVFQSDATNFVLDDTNLVTDIFLRDTQTNTTTRVSVATDGTEGNDYSTASFISSDGRYVVFESVATNLVLDDTNLTTDIFLRDTQTNTTTRVSVATDGTEGNNTSAYSAISGDGKYIAFRSYATNLVTGDTNNQRDIFLRNLQNNTTTRVSVSSSGVEGDGASYAPSISSDGRYVAFRSLATNLVTGDINSLSDIFVRDILNNITTRISLSVDGLESNSSSDYPTISADGKYVAFQSNATNLIPDIPGSGQGNYYLARVRDPIIVTPVPQDSGPVILTYAGRVMPILITPIISITPIIPISPVFQMTETVCRIGEKFSTNTGLPCTSYQNPPVLNCPITLTLRLGSKGVQVKCLQIGLNISSDGSFGLKTKAAVIVFQKSKNLVPDGIFGPKSRALWDKN